MGAWVLGCLGAAAYVRTVRAVCVIVCGVCSVCRVPRIYHSVRSVYVHGGEGEKAFANAAWDDHVTDILAAVPPRPFMACRSCGQISSLPFHQQSAYACPLRSAPRPRWGDPGAGPLDGGPVCLYACMYVGTLSVCVVWAGGRWASSVQSSLFPGPLYFYFSIIFSILCFPRRWYSFRLGTRSHSCSCLGVCCWTDLRAKGPSSTRVLLAALWTCGVGAGRIPCS